MEESTKNGNGTQINGSRNPLNMLDAVARLKSVGMPSEQAEEVVRVQYELIDSKLATKEELQTEANLIRKDMNLVRKDIKNSIYLTVAALAAVIYTMAQFGMLSIGK